MDQSSQDESQKSPDYFPLPCFQQAEQPAHLVKGLCAGFICEEEQDERGLDEFQKHPFHPIAKHFRNQIYTNPSRIRTPSALYQSLQYLKSTFFLSALNDKKKIKKIITDKTNSQVFKTKPQLQKILTVLQKQSQLGLLEQAPFYPFEQNVKPNPMVDKIKNHFKKPQPHEYKDFLLPEKILVFLETRLQAIRCELYAQAIVFPKLSMELLKCEIFLYTLKENEYSGSGYDINSQQGPKLVGLDTLLGLNIKSTLIQRNDFEKIYHQALTIAIFRYSKHQLTRLIDEHDEILTNPALFTLFQLRLCIESGNYQKYFMHLRDSNDSLVICLLLTHLENIRQRICHVIKSAKIDVKKSWLAFLLGLSIKPEEENQIINLNKNSTYVDEKQENKEVESRQKQVKNWIKLEDLFDQLILSDAQVSQTELKVNDL